MRIMLFLWGILSCATLIGAPKTLLLENDRLRAEFNADNGALVRLIDKQSGWNVMNRSVLGQSFEMLMPLNDVDMRFNVVKGVEQIAPVIEQGNNMITFTWNGVRTANMKQTADVTFVGSVALSETGLEYGGVVTNNSNIPIEYVSWPCIGEISIPDKNQPLFHTTRLKSKLLFPIFFNEHGYWGVDYPTSTYQLPEHAYVMVNNNYCGFIVYGKAKSYNQFMIPSFELIPGFEIRDHNPLQDEIDGELVRVQFKVNHIACNAPGEKSVLEPVKFAFFNGSWLNAIDMYRKDNMVRHKSSAEWMEKPLVWQKISAGNGETLLRIAKESVKCGVEVLQVRGWYRNNSGEVVQSTDMADAITACQKLGLRVVLETNWNSVNTHSQIYKDELYKYVIADPFGAAYHKSLMCPISMEIQKRVVDGWSKLDALHVADGVINNDNNHQEKSYLCFDSGHGHKSGAITAHGTLTLDSIMVARIKVDNPKIVALGFGFMDQQKSIYDGYQINVNDDFYVAHRYINPELPIISTVDVRNARKDVNEAVLNRFNFSYDLRFYNDRIQDYTNVVLYGNTVAAFRNKYADVIWNSEYKATKGAIVNGNNTAYSVFVNKAGKRAVIVVNSSDTERTSASVAIDNANDLLFASPEHPDASPFTGVTELEPMSMIIVFEK